MPTADRRLLAVPNVSEGTERTAIDELRSAFADAAVALLDEHSDRVHNRTVFSLAGEEDGLLDALSRLARSAIERIDIFAQQGAHPRIGALDVCPVVYLDPEGRTRARELAVALGGRLGSMGLPVFLYGELASAPERGERAYFRKGGHLALGRRMELEGLRPDFGPGRPHPTAGAVLVGARAPLAAFNVVLAPGATMEDARAIAARLRESGGGLPGVRAIAVALGPERVQVSTNVHDPVSVPLAEVVRTIARLAMERGTRAIEAELVGLVPEAALLDYPETEIPIVNCDAETKTIEARLAASLEGPDRKRGR